MDTLSLSLNDRSLFKLPLYRHVIKDTATKSSSSEQPHGIVVPDLPSVFFFTFFLLRVTLIFENTI